MEPNRWQQIEALFHTASELDERDRENFIRESCKSDAVKNELMALLEQHDSCTDHRFNSPFVFQSGAGLTGSGGKDSATLISADLDSALRQAAARIASEAHNSTFDSILVGDHTLVSDRVRKLSEIEVRDIIGRLDDQFEFRELLGQGGMGAVVRAYDRQLDREVAIKLIVGDSLTNDARQEIIRESKAVAKVKSDHIIDIYSVSNVDATNESPPFLVLELVEGLSLSQLIRNRKHLEPELSAEFTKQIARGLAAAHENGLVHCDIKPANVLIEQIKDSESVTRWRVKIADFGLARATESQRGSKQDPLQALSGKIAGTPAYMSLEQLTDPKNVDHRTDIYSLGATLYEMMTGEPPFRGSKYRILREIQLEGIVPPRQLDEHLPRDLESICLKAMSNDPRQRYQTALELVADVTRFQNGEPTHARPLSSLTRCARWCRRNSTIVTYAGLTAAALLLLALASLWFAYTVANKDRIIAQQQRTTLAERLNAIENAKPAALPLLVEDIEADPQAIDQLESRFKSNSIENAGATFNVALALGMLGNPKTESIVGGIVEVLPSPDMCLNVVDALQQDRDVALKTIASQIDKLQQTADSGDLSYLARLWINRFYLDEFRSLESLAVPSSDPSLRTQVIHEFVNWHADLQPLLDRLSEDDSSRWMICQMLGLLDPKTLSPSAADQVFLELKKVRADATTHATYANAGWALKNWGQTMPDRKPASDFPSQNWERWEIGEEVSVDLVRIEPTTALLGRLKEAIFKNYPEHEVTITKPFFIASTETTVEMYQQFLLDPNLNESGLPSSLGEWNYDEKTSPTPAHPIQKVSWYDVTKFCNWLSYRHQLTPCYRTSEENYQVTGSDGKIYEHAVILIDPNADGFRLPTGAEWEVACRAGAETKFFFGSDPQLFSHYGVDSVGHFKACLPVKSLMPNSFGLFEMHGSVWEWCNDWHSYLDETSLVDPVGPKDPELTAQKFGRIIRGGGVRNVAGATTCASRGHNWPHVRHSNVGFRVARNATPVKGE